MINTLITCAVCQTQLQRGETITDGWVYYKTMDVDGGFYICLTCNTSEDKDIRHQTHFLVYEAIQKRQRHLVCASCGRVELKAEASGAWVGFQRAGEDFTEICHVCWPFGASPEVITEAMKAGGVE